MNLFYTSNSKLPNRYVVNFDSLDTIHMTSSNCFSSSFMIGLGLGLEPCKMFISKLKNHLLFVAILVFVFLFSVLEL